MTWLEPLGILISIILIIYLAIRGFNIIFIAPLCGILVILTNGMDIFGSLISLPNSYMMGLSKFLVNYFGVFMLGSILAKYMEESGAAVSIAKTILRITGTEKPYSVLLALFLISAILTYGGISLFVVMFALIPLSRPIFKAMNLSWSLISIPLFFGAATFTMTMLPGTPSVQNVIPTVPLKTTLTAAPLLGMIGTVAALIFGLWYMKHELNKSIRNGEKYEVDETNNPAEVENVLSVEENVKLPSTAISLAPSLVLLILIFIGSIMKIPNIILIGLVISNILSALLFKNYIPSQKNVINAGAQGAVLPIFFTAATVGFGTIITSAPGFKIISDAIFQMPGNPIIGLSITTSIITVITGSSSGAIGIIMQSFAKDYLAMGISPEVLHRVTAIASSALTPTPHSGVLLTFFALAGLNYKSSYKRFFITIAGANSVALIAVLIAAIIIY